ncbi:MAG: UDP-N-acetylmuramoyl-tripeptide--D-alanyl-D-alanine ligase [Bacteroidota bacterium]
MKIQDLYQIYLNHPIISTDTRTCQVNSLFFCLKGESFDGNKFALNALDMGVAYAISDDKSIIHPKVILVDDALKTLQDLARFHRLQLNIPVIGITGTNGKTTTKELVSAVLKSKFIVTSTLGNLNNHIGVPLTLLSINKNTEIAVIEMGANHIGEIAELCEIVQPNFGLITNIGKAHLEGFGGIDGVISTKKALFDAVIANQGTLFVNSNDDLLMKLSNSDEAFLYGIEKGLVIGKITDYEPTISVSALNTQFVTQLVGSYNLPNILAAISIGVFFNIDLSLIQSALLNYTPSNNRSQLINTANNQVFMDAYNANPSSMEVAISHFATMDKHKKVAILGDMKELGDYSLSEHSKIVEYFEQFPQIEVFFVGPEFSKVTKNTSLTSFQTSNEAVMYLKDHPICDAFILLKGSRGIRMETILEAL